MLDRIKRKKIKTTRLREEKRGEKFFFLVIVWKKLAWNVKSKRFKDYKTTTIMVKFASVQKQKQKEIESRRRRCVEEYNQKRKRKLKKILLRALCDKYKVREKKRIDDRRNGGDKKFFSSFFVFFESVG